LTLVDSNALLDIFTADPVWCDWSTGQLDAASLRGPLCINDVIYAELSVRFDRIEVLDTILAEMKLGRRPIPAPALFLAGKVFRRYRKAGGARTGVLPDFFIGAQAAVEGVPLLTRDQRRYTSYFPTVTLISP
jgi:predicted nucleic acid-binding protein